MTQFFPQNWDQTVISKMNGEPINKNNPESVIEHKPTRKTYFICELNFRKKDSLVE